MLDSIADLAARAVNHLELSSPYVYTPSKAPGYAYIAVFGLGLLIHVILGFKYKYWIAFVTLIPGGVLEVTGWAGRLWSSYKVLNSNPFLMQIVCLILGPAFFSAWAYTILGYCITKLGPAYSLLKPKWYLIVFISADIISLVLQAIGGGGAAVAAKNGTDTKNSTHIMLAGILFQLGTMTIFIALAIDFIVRVITRRPHSRNPPSSSSLHSDPSVGVEGKLTVQNSASSPDSTDLKKVELLLAGVAFASAMIYVRGVYRSIELAQGWRGYLITHEDYFTYLDGLPMALCFYAFAILHPGFLLPKRRGWKKP